MRFLKTNTATRITVGPFLDKTDGITPEVALTVTSCKLTFMVDTDGVPTLVLDVAPTASGGNNDMVHVTGDDAGFYDLELTAANVNYVGRAMLAITDVATHCPVFHEFMILSAQAFEALCGTGNFSADVIAISGDTTAADNCELMFDGTGYAGGTARLKVDVDTIKTQVITCAAGVTVLASVGTAATSTAQTGDSYAIINGASGCVAIKSDTAAILTDTAVIGAAGAGLTAIPWNAAWDAEVQSEVDDALVAQNLDHLVKIAVDTNFATTVHLDSVIGQLADNGTAATYDRTTDSLEVIRDRGDAAWITATGFSTHAAADVWGVATRLLTAGTNIVLAKGVGVTGFNDIAATDIVSAGAITTSGGAVSLVTTTTTATTATNLTNAPTNGDLTATMKTSVTTACTSATPALSAAGVDAIHDEVVEGTLTLRQICRLFLSVLCGKSAGGGTVTVTMRDNADLKARITATCDGDGNRTAVTLDGT